MRITNTQLLATVVMCLLVASGISAAQDTAPPGCERSEHRQFDFWIGEWIVTSVKGDTVGTNTIQPVSDRCALLEQWRGSGGVSGTSINFFEPETGRWNQLWVGGRGLILRLEGRLRDGVMELDGTRKRATPEGPVLDRLRWTPMAGDSVEQLWLVSSDDGATWRESFRGIYRRRQAATSQDSITGIARLRSSWIAAYQQGDSAAMAALYVDDAARMPYDSAPQHGRSEVLAAYAASFRTRTLLPTIALVPDQLHVMGDRAAERGRYHERLRSRDGRNAFIEAGKYVSLVRKDNDGVWRYEWSIFNRDAPARRAGE